MLNSARARWAAARTDNKRAIVGIICLIGVLAIVVIATVSKSASIREVLSPDIWQNIRLPESVRPSHYNVKLKIDMTEERFSGWGEVTIDVTESTAVLLLHINNVYSTELGPEMNITSYHVYDSSGDERAVKHSFPFSTTSFFVMKMKQELSQGEYRLVFEWKSRLVYALDGVYLSSYEEEGVKKKLLASQMEPLSARKVMPCFDEPSFKAEFTIEMTTEKSYGIVLANMPEVEQIDVDETWVRRTFGKSVKMSTYLLAFVVADFACTDVYTTKSGVKARTCGRKMAIEEGAGDYSAKMTATIIDKYEKFYDEKFPLTKIDSVAAPDFSAGAMENWGLILYRETALLYNPDKDTYGNKARVNVVVAHELAHQWFGNLVTMKWWNDLWLNEGFASYVEWIGTTYSEPLWKYLDLQTFSDRSRAFAVDSYMSSRPTSIAVEKPTDITAQFDSISYSKGSSLLVQAKMFMDHGPENTENFEDAIRAYIQRYKFDNAVQNDLYAELDKVYRSEVDNNTDLNMVDVMGSWTLQMNFPVLSVERYDANTLAVSQRRFLISGPDTTEDKPSPYGYQWYVPVEYTVDDGEVQFSWLRPHETLLIPFNFTDPASFIHLNKQSAGYYLVDYSYDMGDRLSKAISIEENYRKMSVPERQGLLYDTFLLISSGAKPMSEGLKMLDIMSGFENQDDSLTPLKEISRQIASVAVHISVNDTLNDKWQKKYTPWATEIFTDFGADYFNTNSEKKLLPTDDVDYGFQHRNRVTFAVSTGCSYKVPACVEAATAKFALYKDGYKNGSTLSPDFKSTILKTAMSREVTPEVLKDWEFLWEVYQASDSATEKDTIYYALGLIQDETTLIKLCTYCLDDELMRPSDALYVLGRSVPQTKLGRDVSWTFMKTNWSRITQEFTDALFAVNAYIAGVLSNFADVGTLKEIEDFFSPQLETLGSGKAAYESSIQSIKGNIEWLKRHRASVETSVA